MKIYQPIIYSRDIALENSKLDRRREQKIQLLGRAVKEESLACQLIGILLGLYSSTTPISGKHC